MKESDRKLRVLWFTNSPSCYKPANINYKRNGYNGGGWISAAENAIKNTSKIDLAISFILDGEPFKNRQGDITYYPIPNRIKSKQQKILDCIKIILDRNYQYEEATWNYYIDHFKRILEDYQPDIIHVWGSENYFGLVSRITKKPILLHIQGILNSCFNAYLPPSFSWKHFTEKSTLHNILIRKRYKNACHREENIIKNTNLLLGRTNWDNHVTRVFNPQSKYYHVDEILRKEFYLNSIRKTPTKLTIISIISQPLYKGYDLILKTAKLLSQNIGLEYEWKCYGNISPVFIENYLGINHNDVNVTLKGIASPQELKDNLLNATLYFHPSYIDNSPNSICEAQILGLPVISTNVGGISSLIEHNVDGFLIPANDPFQAVYYIKKIYEDLSLNISMGAKAKAKAVERHDPEKITNQILEIYFNINK